MSMRTTTNTSASPGGTSAGPTRKRGKALRHAAAVVAIGALMTSAGAATSGPASAATFCCGSLSITYRNDLPASTPYLVGVYARTSRYYNPFETKVEIRLWGEDTFSDDFLKGPITNVSRSGTELAVEFSVSGSTLNEDWADRDEIYAGIRIVSLSTGKVLEAIETNRVKGWFS